MSVWCVRLFFFFLSPGYLMMLLMLLMLVVNGIPEPWYWAQDTANAKRLNTSWQKLCKSIWWGFYDYFICTFDGMICTYISVLCVLWEIFSHEMYSSHPHPHTRSCITWYTIIIIILDSEQHKSIKKPYFPFGLICCSHWPLPLPHARISFIHIFIVYAMLVLRVRTHASRTSPNRPFCAPTRSQFNYKNLVSVSANAFDQKNSQPTTNINQ